jgi:hypothetical protein
MGLKKAWIKGFRGQALTSETLFYFMELNGLSLALVDTYPQRTAAEE